MQQDAVQANDNQLKALALRKAGVSYIDIAKTLGYKDHSGAWRAVKAGLKKTLQEPADELRTLELARLDDMLKAIAPHISAGNLTAIDRALKIQQRRAALLGLDMPAKMELTGKDGEPLQPKVDNERFDRALLTLTDALGAILSDKGNGADSKVDTPK
jgi:hypothetical protein